MRTPSLFRFFFLALVLSPSLLSAQWTKTNGLPGGNVADFIRFDDTIVVNTARLHYSTDDGQNWAPLKSSGCYYTYKLAKDSANLYAYGEQDSLGKVVSWSTDFGQTWTWNPLPANMYFDDFLATQGFLYGTDYQHIYRSADHGAHWDTMPTQLVSRLKIEGQRMIGISSSGLMMVESLDGGFTWDTLLQSNKSLINIIVHENYLFAFCYSASGGCWSSSDYGQTWQHFTGTAFDQFYNFVWHEGTIFGLKGSQVYHSTDLGATWSFMWFTSPNPGYAGISGSNSVLIGGGYSGVWRSTDAGESWLPANQGLFSTTPAQLSITDQGLFAPGSGGIFRLQSDTVGWNNMAYAIVPTWDQLKYIAFLQSGNNLVLCSGYSTCWVSVDGGITWQKPSVPPSWANGGAATIMGLEGGQIMAILDNGDGISTYLSTDHGLSFHGLGTLYAQFNTYIRHFDFNAGLVNFLADDGNIYQTSNGEQWYLLTDNVPIDSLNNWFGYGSQVFVRSNSIWIFNWEFDSTKLAFSTDLGQTWTISALDSAGFNWGNSSFRNLLQVGNYLFAATTRGIFYSNDGGLNWTNWSEGLELKPANILQVYNGYMWAAMNDDGIWKRPLSDLGISATETVQNLDATPSLEIQPNPVSDFTKLYLPDAGLLTVTDLSGRVKWQNKITTGVTELDVRNWSNGVYYLIFDNSKQQRKGVLIVQR